MGYQSDTGGLCRLFLNGDIFHYVAAAAAAAAAAAVAAHPGRDEETVVLKQVLFCSGCQLSLPALSLRQPWSIFDLWLPKLFNFWRSHRCSIFLFFFFYPSTLLHPRAALWEKWIFLLVQQRVFCTRSEPGSQNIEIFVYGGTKDVCRCHSNGLEEHWLLPGHTACGLVFVARTVFGLIKGSQRTCCLVAAGWVRNAQRTWTGY